MRALDLRDTDPGSASSAGSKARLMVVGSFWCRLVDVRCNAHSRSSMQLTVFPVCVTAQRRRWTGAMCDPAPVVRVTNALVLRPPVHTVSVTV